ncbi:endochitinase-like isoform X1 [Dermacentor albipictus]|uniref:endochitinase-like isoform X1 n=2 Tax=Dermacentor albipictus TaxID=60249 RepID=UPI0038FD04FA
MFTKVAGRSEARTCQKRLARTSTMFNVFLCGFLLVHMVPTVRTDDDFIRNGGSPVVCYYHGWAADRFSPMNYRIRDIPGDLCTHVNLNYAGIDKDTLGVKDLIPAYQNNSHYKDFTAIKKKFLFVKTLISLGGWDHGGESFSYVAADRSRRCNFTRNLMKFLKENDFDGVDIDWRFPASPDKNGKPEDKQNYVLFLKSLCKLRRKGLIVTATVPITPFYLDNGYDVRQLSKYVDWLNVIGFDLRGRWTGIADVHSPLYARSFETGDTRNLNVAQGLKRLVELGAPKKKLVLGIPFFGRSYVLADKEKHKVGDPIKDIPAAPGPFIGSTEILAYYEICTNIEDGIATREFDNEGKCPYIYYEDQWVGYEDEESVGIKVDFIIKEGYAGVMVFNNDMDDFNGVCGTTHPLLKVVYQKLSEAPERRRRRRR